MKRYIRYILDKLGGRIVSRIDLLQILEKFNEKNKFYYLLKRKYILRIFGGVYYVRTIEEILYDTYPSLLKTLSNAMTFFTEKWFFGLYTALMLNRVTSEYYRVYYIVNNKLYRPHPIQVLGHKVRIVKFSEKLFGFGIIRENNLIYSDIERTILDLAYWMHYRSEPETLIIRRLRLYTEKIDKNKILSYLNYYPKSLRKIINAILS